MDSQSENIQLLGLHGVIKASFNDKLTTTLEKYISSYIGIIIASVWLKLNKLRNMKV